MQISLPAQRRALTLSADPWLWGGFACVWAVSTLWCRAEQISIGYPSGVMFGLAALLMAASCLVRALFPNAASIAIFCESIALYGMFPIAFAPLTYAAARSPFPVIDPALRAIDLLAGFDGDHWRSVVQSSPTLCWLQTNAYCSLMPQCFLALAILPQVSDGRRGLSLLRAASVSLSIISALCFCFPAAMPSADAWFADWHALHDTAAPFATDHVDGLVTFPSFHACMAVLLIYAMRRLGALFWVALALNAAMISSTPAIGFHYLSDVVAGIVVAGVAILAVRSSERRAVGSGLQTARP